VIMYIKDTENIFRDIRDIWGIRIIGAICGVERILGI
jgi:hypothetical protein